MRTPRVLVSAAACLACVLAPASARAQYVDANGVVFRSYGGGPQFHPLGSFQQLNGYMDAGRRVKAARLARALIRRGDRDGNALVWPYRFTYQGNAPGWRSGMAQAVAAEALARAGYRRAAWRAFLAVDDLLVRPNGLLWIKLYSFSPLPVLNAQLQAALSLRRYASIMKDRRAMRMSQRLLASADALFPHFETACWSRYSLLGREAPPKYHRYVGELVMRVAARTPSWRARAGRIYASQRRPVLGRAVGSPTVYPIPQDGFRDRGTFSFWLSKCAWVTVRVGKYREERAWFAPGKQQISWKPRGIPGNYPVRLIATDAAGRRAWLRLPDLVVRRDIAPPRVAASVARGRLHWRAYDGATPWLRVAVEFTVAQSRLTLPLGRHELRGSVVLPTLPWNASATLVASDSSGNTARVRLGAIGPLSRIASRVLPQGTR